MDSPSRTFDRLTLPGKILFTAEGQEIHFRNVRLTPGPR